MKIAIRGNLFYFRSVTGDETHLIGYLPLLRRSMEGGDIAAEAARLLDCAKRSVNAANSLMDLTSIFFFTRHREMALSTQSLALNIKQLYSLRAPSGQAKLRLLALLPPGDYLASTPLEFLLEGSDVALDLLFVGAGLPFPADLPTHDVLFNAVCEADENLPLLKQIDHALCRSPRPILNAPRNVPRLARDRASAILHGSPGIAMPITIRVDRQILAKVGRGECAFESTIGEFPIIVRPVGSHMGKDLVRCEDRHALAVYLESIHAKEFYVARFVDYHSSDGLFRKVRIALVDGRAFACHLAISNEWMVNYVNSNMEKSPEKRDEEARFLEHFDEDFCVRHAEALRAIYDRFQLDYLVIDCSETADHQLLIFEIDSAALVHAIDPVDLFPYKQPVMRKLFSAFRHMLELRARA